MNKLYVAVMFSSDWNICGVSIRKATMATIDEGTDISIFLANLNNDMGLHNLKVDRVRIFKSETACQDEIERWEMLHK